MLKLMYKPIGVGASVLGGLIAGSLFKQLWRLAAGETETPRATDADRGWGEIAASAALEGAVFGVTKALVDRLGATGFAQVTGVWPGRRTRSRDDR